MEYRTMLLLDDIQQERRVIMRKEQQYGQLVRQASRPATGVRQCAHWLIGLGLALQRYGQAIEEPATAQELHLSR